MARRGRRRLWGAPPSPPVGAARQRLATSQQRPRIGAVGPRSPTYTDNLGLVLQGSRLRCGDRQTDGEESRGLAGQESDVPRDRADSDSDRKAQDDSVRYVKTRRAPATAQTVRRSGRTTAGDLAVKAKDRRARIKVRDVLETAWDPTVQGNDGTRAWGNKARFG
ncbi:hypothetical protein CF326_g7961 [Tilletia indica]|nr:hypothetical protein CF326_g7961 [Tilletia indica]